MAIHIKYKIKGRSWCQKQLTDWMPELDLDFKKLHEIMVEWRWQVKKEHYYKQKQNNKKNLPPLRRGMIPRAGPTRNTYNMDIPAHVAEIKRFPWFTRNWHQHRQVPPRILPRGQTTLDRWLPAQALTTPGIAKPVNPRMKGMRTVQQDEFCSDMTSFAWVALHRSAKEPAALFYLFYLNDFSVLDEDELIKSPEWRTVGRYLPSDIVKYELARLILGYSTFSDYLRTVELFPSFEDHLAIAMARHVPKGGRLVQALQKIGPHKIRTFFEALVQECRALGLIQDRVWLWDGQFIAGWIKRERKQDSRNKSPVWGGWYNHGGKKVGFGIVQSVIVDWSGSVPLPIEVRVYPANNNDNIVFRDTFSTCMNAGYEPATFMAADKGPSGKKSLELVYKRGLVPVMALGKNRKNDVIVTSKKKYKFNASLTKNVEKKVLERVYKMRTRIEELFSVYEDLFKMARMHACGPDFMEVEVLLMNILVLLVSLTAFKIGRPDLARSPRSFTNFRVSPNIAFPERMQELQKLRD